MASGGIPSGCSDLPVISGKEEVPSGGLVTGIGQVHGRAVAIVANDATGEQNFPFMPYKLHCYSVSIPVCMMQ